MDALTLHGKPGVQEEKPVDRGGFVRDPVCPTCVLADTSLNRDTQCDVEIFAAHAGERANMT